MAAWHTRTIVSGFFGARCHDSVTTNARRPCSRWHGMSRFVLVGGGAGLSCYIRETKDRDLKCRFESDWGHGNLQVEALLCFYAAESRPQCHSGRRPVRSIAAGVFGLQQLFARVAVLARLARERDIWVTQRLPPCVRVARTALGRQNVSSYRFEL